MELTINHLSAYLPYNLKVQYVIRGNVEETGIMTKLARYEDETHPARVGIHYANSEHIWMFKPILKPMSKLTRKELQDSGFLDKLIHQNDIILQMENEAKLNFNIEKMSYKLAQYLLSEHYDIFGLIEAGLAVEK